MTELVPVLLSGGSGTRLWPLSRETHPKQFQPPIGAFVQSPDLAAVPPISVGWNGAGIWLGEHDIVRFEDVYGR